MILRYVFWYQGTYQFFDFQPDLVSIYHLLEFDLCDDGSDSGHDPY